MRIPFPVVIAACAVALVLEPSAAAQSSAQTPSRCGQGTTTVAATSRFEFCSDPWINLHHFLYQWAREEAGLNRGRSRVPVPERAELAALSDEDRSAWLQSVSVYRERLASKGHFDPEMLAIKEELLGLGGDPGARPSGRIAEAGEALRNAMPVYLRRWWPRHDKANRAWTESVTTRLRTHEQRFVEMTIRVYGAVWPEERWRVDVSAYANWAAGYTTSDGHVVIYSTDPRNQGLYALETVLHEIQHARVILGRTLTDLSRAFEAAGADPPGNLWHALIFATAGEFVRSAAASEGSPAYIPYWIKEGFGDRLGWGELMPAVNRHWLPVVRGETSREEAFAALARALAP